VIVDTGANPVDVVSSVPNTPLSATFMAVSDLDPLNIDAAPDVITPPVARKFEVDPSVVKTANVVVLAGSPVCM
jgi:hypothetical protein